MDKKEIISLQGCSICGDQDYAYTNTDSERFKHVEEWRFCKRDECAIF